MKDETLNIKAPREFGAIRVTYSSPGEGENSLVFTESFRVGRENSCPIYLPDPVVSKRHLEICRERGGWWVRDLGSRNGTFLNGERVQHALISKNSVLRIASNGPSIRVELLNSSNLTSPLSETSDSAENQTRKNTISETQWASLPSSVTKIVKKFSGGKPSGNADPGSVLMHDAFKRVKQMESRRHRKITAIVSGLFILAAVFGLQQYFKFKNLKQMGIEIFYEMKSMEMQVEDLYKTAANSGENTHKKQLAARHRRLEELRDRYTSFVEETGIFSKYTDEKDRAIFRMARLFGECDLNVPEPFFKEVKKYIELWRTTPRLSRALARVEKNRFAARVFRTMLTENLPPQFLYIALQESDFKAQAIGPRTRFGIAKGFWQFIPTTAAQYGLQTGPLVELPRYDPKDERFDFDKATRAAARYLHYIYSTEAQASGLLVVASYNWGYNNVRRRIRKMPTNPRERNFWKLMETHEIPRETYDYVLYVFSAAVIGENPGLFGFEFENPLREYRAEQTVVIEGF
ncbi:MAG: FHA domain-containing protein [Deltaproteobacteria bacterium]|nr:FHA domain-containing protein [Deltaproteobacteria bacterium]